MQIEELYVKCTECGKWYIKTQLVSMHVPNWSKKWSDGKDEGIEYTDIVPFVKCEHCYNLFWIEDAPSLNGYFLQKFFEVCKSNSIHEIEEHTEFKTYSSEQLALVKELSSTQHSFDDLNLSIIQYPLQSYDYYEFEERIIGDLQKLTSSPLSNQPEREIIIRKLLWQVINDYYRMSITKYNSFGFSLSFGMFKKLFDINYRKQQKRFREKAAENFQKYASLYKSNLLRLKKLMERRYEKEEDELFLYIELHRTLGEFRKANELINQHFFKDEPSFIKKSRQMIRKQRKDLFVVQE